MFGIICLHEYQVTHNAAPNNILLQLHELEASLFIYS